MENCVKMVEAQLDLLIIVSVTAPGITMVSIVKFKKLCVQLQVMVSNA